jgi:tetratricopeptide (TPR) repeat protein
MADVFISYSHQDSEFVKQLHSALIARNRQIWIDWSNIRPTAEWWEEITKGIELSNNFIFIISNHSLASFVCNLEIEYARSLNKRIVPVLISGIDVTNAHEQLMQRQLNDFERALLHDFDLLTLARENWTRLAAIDRISFESPTNFDALVRKLSDALDLDIEYVDEHTRLLTRANEWNRRSQSPSFILYGDDLRGAERWLTGSERKDPQPTELQRKYIATSRRVEKARRIRIIQLLGAALIFVVAASVAAKIFYDAAEVAQREQAIAVDLANASLILTDEEGRGIEAQQIGNTLVKMFPDSAVAYRALGTIYMLVGDMDQAVIAFDQAIALDPNYTYTYLSRANAFKVKGDMDKALADYNTAIELDPGFDEAYNSRGRFYTDQGKFQEAIADFTQVIALDPRSTSAYYNRGIAYHNSGELDNAIDDFTQAININPQIPLAYNNRGIVYNDKGEFAKAFEDFTQAIVLDPHLSLAYNNRGLIYALRGELDKAIDDFTQALAAEINPRHASHYYNRGNVYLARNEFEQAIQDYDRAIELYPQFGDAYFNRAVAYSESNHPVEAVRDWDIAEALGSSIPPGTMIIREMLREQLTAETPVP